jgi:hypothetical protein
VLLYPACSPRLPKCLTCNCMLPCPCVCVCVCVHACVCHQQGCEPGMGGHTKGRGRGGSASIMMMRCNPLTCPQSPGTLRGMARVRHPQDRPHPHAAHAHAPPATHRGVCAPRGGARLGGRPRLRSQPAEVRVSVCVGGGGCVGVGVCGYLVLCTTQALHLTRVCGSLWAHVCVCAMEVRPHGLPSEADECAATCPPPLAHTGLQVLLATA